MANRKYTPEQRTAICVNCSKEFSYLHTTGTIKKHCSDSCRKEWKKVRAKLRKDEYPKCSTDGCCNPAVRVGAGKCEKHYYRQRRGSPDSGIEPTYRYITQAGYVSVLDPSHPLAMKDGRVNEHRKVAYDKHGGDCPDCFWCGAGLTWKTAVVDHLDENKANNAEENLVVSCNPCNRARGAMLPFIKAMKQESFGVFVEQAAKYRSEA